MNIASRQTLWSNESAAPKSFRYLCIKIIANRFMREFDSLSAMNSSTSYQSHPGLQFSEIFFKNDSGGEYSFQNTASISVRTKYINRRCYMDWEPIADMKNMEKIGRIFDGSTTTKYCGHSPYFIYNAGGQRCAIMDFDTGDILVDAGASFDTTPYSGSRNSLWSPAALIADLKDKPIDISIYNVWGFNNANDNSSQSQRTWVEGEILASNNLIKWWRLDIFNDINITNNNYAIAYTGNIVPRRGDIWSDLDLSTRDWTHGISVD